MMSPIPHFCWLLELTGVEFPPQKIPPINHSHADALPIWFYNDSNVQHCPSCEVKITLNIEMTLQPAHPSRQSESLSAKAIQWQLHHSNIGRNDYVEEDEENSNSKHYQLTENKAYGEEDEKTNDATTKC